MKIEEKLQEICIQKKLTLSLAESCTGGAIAARLTQVAGASQYFLGSIVSYSQYAKDHLLGVPKTVLSQYSAVSEEVAILMLKGLLKALPSDLALSVTGIAGPSGGSDTHPVGTVIMAVGGKTLEPVLSIFHFKGNREEVIAEAVIYSLNILTEAASKMR